ncbi:MAG TPA: S-methyl-5'-thioadenosine phosphorylase [Bacteroidales bacterium]|nr:S-methyl-5'-thioadenosine phosphorylase [Bacteroidales bacterium]HRZ48346.1 S-methyl-5'-thioadenosine phosphorylase [Bacteroidales bacterium]
MRKIGIIGGTGLEKLSLFENPQDIFIDTPYGDPSSPLLTGTLAGREVAILSRHGREHTLPPTQINNRANIFALKEYGCDAILAVTACGSLREPIGRGHLVILDQFIDFTKHRISTFFETFEGGVLKHTPMADPFDEELRSALVRQAEILGITFHPTGTVVTIEGPRFSSRAESLMFRSWGADVINMSTAPEVILANEAGIPYAAIAMSTDYDCWKTDEAPVSWEDVLEVFRNNVSKVTTLLLETLKVL